MIKKILKKPVKKMGQMVGGYAAKIGKLVQSQYQRFIETRFGKKVEPACAFLIEGYQALQTVTHAVVFAAKNGKLSWFVIGRLAIKNLLSKPSRTAVTVAAIASGTAAIVFLVGFAYGLQNIVTDRLIQPNSLRLADVQTSSTALTMDKEALDKIKNTSGIEAVEPAVSLAGSININDSKTEVIVVGARNQYLEYSHLEIVDGAEFSEEAEAEYLAPTQNLEEIVRLMDTQIAGVATESSVKRGDDITGKNIAFRIADETYIPIRTAPSLNADVIGYARGSLLERHNGTEVWGGIYTSASTAGKAYQNQDGDWFGKWIEVEQLPAYAETAPGAYMAINEDGSQKKVAGFITQEEVSILSLLENNADHMIDLLLKDQGLSERVLGDATESGEMGEFGAIDDASAAADLARAVSVVVNDVAAASEAAALENLMSAQQQQAASESAVNAILSVPRETGKEILVSTGLLRVLDLQSADVLGKQVKLEYLVSSNLIPNLQGRIATQPTNYIIVGVFEADSSMVYAPLSDFESMGVKKYSIAKILSSTEDSLAPARDRVEALGFITRSIADTLGQVDRLFSVMRFLLGSFGMIAFIVALFGMFNTLTVSLLERTREIGVMKTLGTTDADVVRLLLMESTFIGLFGGMAGILLGMIVAYSIDFTTLFFRADTSVHLFAFPPVFLGLVFLLALVVGVATGMYPAHRAKKITALNALRYE